jgi:serine phosphatase RsbU (regulator of sigma subunit)
MKDMRGEKSSSKETQDIFSQGETLFMEAVKVMGTDDQSAQIRRNELLLKIQDQAVEVNRKLKDVEALQNQLKAHLKNLQQLQKMLSK